MANEFNSLYDKKKDRTYICKDTEARNQIDALALKSREICTTFEFAGSYDSTEDRNFTYLLPFNSIKGRFFGEDGTYIRVLFNDTYTLDFTKPLYFVFDDYSVPITEDQRKILPAYRNRGGTESMAGWFDYDSVLDFVYDKDNECFYMVNAQKASTTAYGQTILSSDTQSTSESTAATSLAVKTVRDMISSATGVDIQVVSTLPTVDISRHTIYLVPKQTAQTDNVYDEYINTDGTSAGWELLGDTSIDLSGYYTKTETDTLLGDKVDKVTGKGLSTEDYTSAEKTKLAGIATGAEVNVQADFSQTDNTADDYIKNKPTFADVAMSGEADDVSYDNTQSGATGGTVQAVIDGLVTLINNLGNSLANKVDKVTGKGLSTEDYTTAEKNKLSGIESGAEQNVQVDWSQTDTTADDYLKNKPTIPSALSDLSDDSTHRVVTDTEKNTWSGKVSDNPTFTEASTRANIASGESFATILGKIKKFFTDLKTVAFTGSYNDLSDQPTIPTSNDYIQKTNGHANGSIDIDSMSGSVSQIAVHGNGSQDANIVANQASIGYIGMRIDGNGYKEIYAMNSNFQDDILLSIDDNRVIGGILGGKQDALTAGSNISISGNTISATDTKPRDGQFDNTPTAVSVSSSTDWSCIAPNDPICTAPAGSVWIVSVALQYPSNTSGFRSIGISTTNTGSTAPAAIMQQTVAPANGAATNLIFTTFVAPATATTYYVWGRQNSGASRNVTYRYRAIRIL